MTPDLAQMTNVELKQYLSEHRNNQDAFQAGLEVLLSRRNPANRQPYPYNLSNPEQEVEAIFREKLNHLE